MHRSSLAAVALLAVLCLPLTAQSTPSFSFTGFPSLAGLTINGSATQVGASVRLTNGNLIPFVGVTIAGSLFHTQQVVVGAGLDTSFDFSIPSSIVPGAGIQGHGLALVIHADPIGPNLANATTGDGLGYAGVTNALVVELDNFQSVGNGDTSNMEISVHTNGTGAVSDNESESIGRATVANFADTQVHTCRLIIANGLLNVLLDTVPVISAPWDFATGGVHLNGNSVGGLNLINGTDAFIGITATVGSDSTGAHVQNTDIPAWSYMAVSPLPVCMSGTVDDGAGGVQDDLLQVNGSPGNFFRTVHTETWDPMTFSINQPPANPAPAPFIIFGSLGAPAVTAPTPFGDFCFLTPFHAPDPSRFVLADSAVMSPGHPAVLPAGPAPWSFTTPFGLPFPLTFSLQGAVLEDNANPLAVAITNTVVVEVASSPPPTITSISPSSPMSGQTVTITGTGFKTLMSLDVAGTPTPINVTSNTTATFTAAATFPCDTPLTLTNPDTQSVNALLSPSPVIATFPISTGPATGGNLFIVTGQNFVPGGAMTVTFGANTASINGSSTNSITGLVPAGISGTTVVVSVIRPDGCLDTTSYTYQ